MSGGMMRAAEAQMAAPKGLRRAGLLGTAGLMLVLALAGCEKEARLPGTRLDPRADAGIASGTVASGPRATPIALPAQGTNADWPQRAGAADHAPGHPSFRATPQLVWSADIGAGSSKRHRLTGDPVVGGGLIFAIDSDAEVSAVTPQGQVAWSTSTVPPGERPGAAAGGGLAYAGGRIYVTTGFGELVALDASSGGVVWRQKFDAGVGGAPTIANGTVYVASRDGSGWAIRAADGRVQWRLQGVSDGAGTTASAAPAVSGDTVIFPFQGGLLAAADASDGTRRWVRSLAGKRTGMGYAIVADVTGDPVVSGGSVYAGTSAGRIASVALASGQPGWTLAEGSNAPFAVAGGNLFAVSDAGRLLRINASNGQVVWAVDLPYDVHTRKAKNRREIVGNHGPVLAGGRLWIAGSDDLLRGYDPASGTMVASVAIPGGAATGLAVAGNTAYVVSLDGKLLAFR